MIEDARKFVHGLLKVKRDAFVNQKLFYVNHMIVG